MVSKCNLDELAQLMQNETSGASAKNSDIKN